MSNYHLINVKYLGATNTHGERVKLTSARFEQSITLPYSYMFDDALQQAKSWLTANGHNVLGQGQVGSDIVVIVGAHRNTFKALKEDK